MSDGSTPLPTSSLRSCAEGTNPNVMANDDFEALKASIEAVGFNQPILVAGPRVDSDGVAYYEIVDGHHRTSAMLALGFAVIPAVIRDWTDETIRAVRLAMNRLRGMIDMRVAQNQIVSLVEAGWTPEQLTLTGFNAQELVLLSEESKPKESSELLDVGATNVDVSDPTVSAKPFTLEIKFVDKASYQLAKRKLKKAAGNTNDLALGLLAVLGEEK